MKNILLIFFLAAFTSCYTVKPCQCPEPKIIEVVRYPENDFLIDPGFSHPGYIPYDSIKAWEKMAFNYDTTRPLDFFIKKDSL